MKNKMTISVLMSVWREEKAEYLDAAIRSIWTEQTRKPDELVLVEDGELNMELYIVIERWKSMLGKNMIIVKNEQNLGLAKSLNKGIAACTGDVIARMDSDDISLPERFAKEEEYMKSHPDVDIVGGDIQEFSVDRGLLSIRRYPRSNKEIKSTIHRANPLAHSTVMMRRYLFECGLNYNGYYKKMQDLELWFRVLKAGYHISNLNEVVLYFRRNDELYRRRSREAAIWEFRVYVNGIYNMYGLLTYYYIYPCMRLLCRLMPNAIMRTIYDSRIRTAVTTTRNSSNRMKDD